MKRNLTLTVDAIKLVINEYLANNKVVCIFGIIVISIGVLIGVWLGIGNTSNFIIQDIPDTILYSYLDAKISIFGLFLLRNLVFLLICCIMWICSFKRFTCIINYIVIFVNGFILGLTSVIIIDLFGICGIICLVLVYIPRSILFNCALLLWIIVCLTYSANNCFCGNFCIKNFICSQKEIIFIVFMINFISTILELILLPIFSIPLILD